MSIVKYIYLFVVLITKITLSDRKQCYIIETYYLRIEGGYSIWKKNMK